MTSDTQARLHALLPYASETTLALLVSELERSAGMSARLSKIDEILGEVEALAELEVGSLILEDGVRALADGALGALAQLDELRTENARLTAELAVMRSQGNHVHAMGTLVHTLAQAGVLRAEETLLQTIERLIAEAASAKRMQELAMSALRDAQNR